MAIAFLIAYVATWLCLFAAVMEGEPRAIAANFPSYVALAWSPGAGELPSFIQLGALATAATVAVVGVPGWHFLRVLWRRSRA